MDDKILKAIRENDIAQLETHRLESVGFNGLVCDALHALSINTLADLVTYGNKQRLIAIIDALPAEDKKIFYSLCRKLNIRISEEMRTTPRKGNSSTDEKKQLVNAEYLSKYITNQTNNFTIAWVKAIKGTEYNLSLSYLKTLYEKEPSLDEIRTLRCYYSAISAQSFSDYCLREFCDFGVDTQYKSLSLLLTYITINYELGSEHESDEFIVYQLFNEHDDEANFQGLFVIKKEQIEEDLLVRKNCIHFNNLFNQENNGKHRLNKNLYRIRSHIAMQKHYRYLLERCGIRFELIKNIQKTIQALSLLRENTSTQFFVGEPETDCVILKQIEDSLGRKINGQDSIDELDLSVRTFNCLKRSGIRTIDDLKEKTEVDLRKIRNLGRRSYEEVLSVLYAHGYRIKDDPESPVEYKFSEIVSSFNIRNFVLDSNGCLVDFFAQQKESTTNETIESQDTSIVHSLSIEDTIDKLILSVRSFNCLKRQGINTIGDLINLTYEELQRGDHRGLGHILGIRSTLEIIVQLFDNGYRLKDCPEEQYPTIEAYLLDKVSGGKERILEAFPDGVLVIGGLQGRKLDFETTSKFDAVVVEKSDDLKKKTEELDAREAELERRVKELAEKEERLHRLEAELRESSTELKAAREELEELRQQNDTKAREVASTLDARERQLALDIQAHNENLAWLAQKQAEFDAWAERTRLELEEEQKKNALTRIVTSLAAIRKMIDSQLEEERAYILQGAEAEIQRIRAESERFLKATEKEHEATVKSLVKDVTDKTVALDNKINDINTLVIAMKKVIDDIASAISARISSLQRTKSQLQTELNAITGMFSGSQRKPIESRIQQIESEIVFLTSLKKLIDDYREEMKNEAMFKAMKSIELSFTPDKPSPKATSAKMFSFVETATTAAIERFVGFSETEVVIPDTYNRKPVVAIASSAFAKCKSIKKIVLGKNLRKIGERAFEECESLEIVEGSSNLISIGKCAFHECKNLFGFEFGSCLEYIGSSAFCRTAIEKVVLSPKITEIESGTFELCPRLKKVVLHDKLISIGDCAFKNCASLEIFEIPKSVQQISQNAFGGRYSSNLRELRVLPMNAEFKIGWSSFEPSKNLIVYCYPNSTAQKFYREKGVTIKSL